MLVSHSIAPQGHHSTSSHVSAPFVFDNTAFGNWMINNKTTTANPHHDSFDFQLSSQASQGSIEFSGLIRSVESPFSTDSDDGRSDKT
ncbi:unnamed protein product [Didymodactylos carnosus]|nr:unnamed protein product [Didymodactylos carnosus]CAF1414931.1 unnamed protein product [Didymodactylos carnosus]CAF3624122.1 unnamed protein product [Didymodactylos carnosus]CAF4217640.1 unnamed protein product [Didymodactylos carnosus]